MGNDQIKDGGCVSIQALRTLKFASFVLRESPSKEPTSAFLEIKWDSPALAVFTGCVNNFCSYLNICNTVDGGREGGN